jgi:hypothetical protein
VKKVKYCVSHLRNNEVCETIYNKQDTAYNNYYVKAGDDENETLNARASRKVLFMISWVYIIRNRFSQDKEYEEGRIFVLELPPRTGFGRILTQDQSLLCFPSLIIV